MSSQSKQSQQKGIRKNARRWTAEERALFSEVLVDEDKNFLMTIEKLALKCSSNDKVFGHIKNHFELALADRRFADKNERNNFKDKNGIVYAYEKLDTSIPKLRAQIKNLKVIWHKITNRCKNDSGLVSEKEPKWYKILNVVLSKTHDELNSVSSAPETSFVADHEEYTSQSENGNDEEDSDLEPSQLEDNQIKEASKTAPTREMVASVHKKRKQVHINKQALSEVVKGLQSVAESQTKRMKLRIEADERREERDRQYRREEAEKNREHELQIAEIYARAFANMAAARNEGVPSSMINRFNIQQPLEQYTPSRDLPEQYPVQRGNDSTSSTFGAPSSVTPPAPTSVYIKAENPDDNVSLYSTRDWGEKNRDS